MPEPLLQTVGFLGAGRMAQALAAGFIRAEVVAAEQITASDPAEEVREKFAELVPGAATTAENASAAAEEIVFLAVKPQNVDTVLADVATQITPEKLCISIAAGITLSRLAARLPDGARLIRVMPNTPCLVGESASVFALGSAATEDDAEIAERLLSSVGIALQLEERHLDAVTGLSGSGPAYVSLVIEALAAGGEKMGLPPEISAALAVQTVRGTATLIQRTGEPPEKIIERVASPGGTTVAGLAVLRKHGLRAALIAAVEAATQRSIELGKE